MPVVHRTKLLNSPCYEITIYNHCGTLLFHSLVNVQAMKIKGTVFIIIHLIILIMEMGKFAKMLNFPFKGPETSLWTLSQHLFSPKRKLIWGNALIFS